MKAEQLSNVAEHLTQSLELRRRAQMLKMVDLVQILRISRSSIYELIRTGCFPKSVQLGKRRVAWRLVDIESWLTNSQPTCQACIKTNECNRGR
jgi:predicted DNA-binding transcriptional regulator AlpA